MAIPPCTPMHMLRHPPGLAHSMLIEACTTSTLCARHTPTPHESSTPHPPFLSPCGASGVDWTTTPHVPSALPSARGGRADYNPRVVCAPLSSHSPPCEATGANDNHASCAFQHVLDDVVRAVCMAGTVGQCARPLSHRACRDQLQDFVLAVWPGAANVMPQTCIH